MLEYDFMVNAALAGTIVAVVAGVVGYVLVLRGQTFAGHALSHVGFTGATGALLVGASPLWGMVGVTVLGGVGMGLLGERAEGRDVAIGMVLSLSLGAGLLFLHFFTAYAAQATALLFGSILGVDAGTIWTLLGLGVVSLAALAAIARPLLFASLQPELAEARGVPMRLVSVLFLAVAALAIIARPLLFASLQPELAEARGVPMRLVSVLFLAVVALATALCVQVVGVLLVFTLLVAPAAASHRLARSLGQGVALSVALALAQTWAGLALAYATDWPVSVWITALGGAAYALACLFTPENTPEVTAARPRES